MKKFFQIFLFVLVVLFFYGLIFGFIFVSGQCNEGETRKCGFTDAGECSYGEQRCINGEWSICYGEIGPQEEICNDNKDNDCDGSVDENCECASGETRKCGIDVGICEFGIERCVDNLWSGCENATLPLQAEICNNNEDDDCDDEVNEGCQQNLTSNCFNNKKDFNEEGVDCGGTCKKCATCFDRIQNQNETGIDCGGSCPACPTCFDGIKNQDEIRIDCGGVCQPCEDIGESDKDNDGLKQKIELQMGTDPESDDSDFDGIKDGVDKMPLCPNNFCDVNYGENEKNCPEDCEVEKEFPTFMVLIFFLLVLAAGVYFFYKHKKSGEKEEKKFEKEKKVIPKIDIKEVARAEEKNLKKSEVERELEKSLRKAERFFK